MWLAIASVAVPMALFAAAAAVDFHQTLQQARADVRSRTDSFAEHSSSVLSTLRVVLDLVEERAAALNWQDIRSSSAFHDMLRKIADGLPEAESVFLVDADGFIAATSRAFPVPRYDVRERQYFEKAQTSGDLYVNAPFLGQYSGTLAFTVTRRLQRGDKFDGLAGVTIRPRYFERLFQSNSAHPGETVGALLRTDGTVLARYPTAADDPPRPPAAVMAALADGTQSGVIETSSGGSVPRLTGFRRIADLPLVVMYSLDFSAMVRPWLLRSALLGLIALLAAFGLFWASRRIVHDADSESDIGRARLEGVVRAMPIGVIVADAPSGRLLFANDQVSRMLLNSAAPLTGSNAFSTLVGFHSDGRRLTDEEWPLARAVHHGEAAPEEEIEIQRGDGSRGSIAISSAPVRDRDGALVAGVVAFYDVTARRESQQRVELLMRETLHRAKNQLALVEAMARQTVRGARDLNEFLDRFSDRLQGLALTQTLLVERQWESIPLRDLLLAQTRPFDFANGRRIVLEGPDVEIAPEPAHNLGLAFHELASNAVRHGALSNDCGRVRVQWGRVDGRFLLEWIERDGPRIDAPPAMRGFGSTVLERIAGAAVDGTVTMEFGKSGLVWRLDGNARYFQ